MFRTRFRIAAVVALLCAVVWAGAAGFRAWQERREPATAYKTPQEADPYVRFDMEAYDLISAGYWQKTSDADLAGYFQLAAGKAAASSTLALPSKDRAGAAAMIASALQGRSEADKKAIAQAVAQIALYNLPPAGRDELLDQGAQTQLERTVDNVQPAQNLYQDLGLKQGAGAADVEAAFEAKQKELAATTSAQGKLELADARQAHATLSNPVQKTIYDATGAEPTVFSRMVGRTLYLFVEQISPTTLPEFTAALDAASSTPADAMIIDLRGDIGGSLDFAPAFLALFLGGNQYAFDLFSRGAYEPQRTAPVAALPELKRYREIAVLTDGMTQSTAEVVAAALKHARIARVVGETTRGLGSVERLFPLATTLGAGESYSMLLVVALTVRDDQNPIEGEGVAPDVNTNDADWRGELKHYFYSPDLIEALSREAASSPLR